MKTKILLLIEAFILSLIYKERIKRLPLSHLIDISTPKNEFISKHDIDTSISIYEAVDICARVLKNKCLAKALVFRHMSNKRYLENSFYIGAKKEDSLSFHAWVNSKGLTSGSESKDYKIIFSTHHLGSTC